MSDVTLREVASDAGVHWATASRALDPQRRWMVRPDTRSRIEASAVRLGYRPHLGAAGLRRGRSAMVGVVVANLGNPFIPSIIRSVADALEDQGLTAIVAETQDDHDRLRRIFDALLGRRVDGIILTGGRLGDEAAIREVVRSGVPVVLATRPIPGIGLACVSHDGRRAGELAAEHLHALGHKDVALVRGPLDVESINEREDGFARASARLGLRVLQGLDGPSDIASGRHQMQVLLSREPAPTGVFATNDLMALGVIDAIRAAGLGCPGDVSVIGHDDQPLADHFSPALTTIHTQSEELGRRAAAMLISAVGKEDVPPEDIRLEPELAVRSSTGVAPTGPQRGSSRET